MKLEGYNDYEIYPETGQVFSYKRNKYIGAKGKNGYYRVTLTSDEGVVWRTYIHRVIWFAVNGDIPDGMQVNHIDEDKNNNSISNLNLMTPKENINYGTGKERKTRSQSKPVVGIKDGMIVLCFQSVNDASRNGYASSRVSACCNGIQKKKYKGYKWRFVN